MSAVVVAVLNRKGGAGKTSLTKDLGLRARRARRAGAAGRARSAVLAGGPRRARVRHAAGPDGQPAADARRSSATPARSSAWCTRRAWGTWLVPASKALASAERALGEPGRGGASQRLKRGLERLDVDERFDLVLIDCPPGMTPLTMNALVAADSVLVPTQLDFLSVAGLAVLMETVEEVREYDNPGLRYLGIVGTQADERTRHAREIRAQLEQLFGDRARAACCAGRRSATAPGSATRTPRGLAVGQFDPAHPVSADYRALADELAVRARLELAIGGGAMSAPSAPTPAPRSPACSRARRATGGLATPRARAGERVDAAPADSARRAAPGRRADRGRRRLPAQPVAAGAHRAAAHAGQQVRRHRRARRRDRAAARGRHRHARRRGRRPRR